MTPYSDVSADPFSVTRQAKFLTQPDKLMMTPNVEFLRYNINIIHVVKLLRFPAHQISWETE